MSTPTKNNNIPALSDRDLELLVCGLRSSEGAFGKVDYKKLAETAGFKNAASASVSFGNVKKKVMGNVVAKATPKKSTPSKRKKVSAAATESDDVDESPAKKAKTPAKTPAKKEQETKEDSDEDGGAAFV